MRWVVAALAGSLACGVGGGAAGLPEQTSDSTAPDLSELPPLDPARGKFAYRTGSPKPEYVIDGEVQVDVVECPVIGALQFFLYEPDYAMGALIGVPDSVGLVGSYPVTRRSQGLPTPGTVRFAAQFYLEDRSFSMPGISGELIIESSEDGLSGHLEAALFENVLLDSVAVQAAFRNLPVIPGEAEYCRVLGDPADSTSFRP